VLIIYIDYYTKKLNIAFTIFIYEFYIKTNLTGIVFRFRVSKRLLILRELILGILSAGFLQLLVLD